MWRPVSCLLGVLVMVLLLLWGVGVPADLHQSADTTAQRQIWYGDALSSYVRAGCMPVPVAGLTLTAFACTGYVRGSNDELRYASQAAHTLGPLNAGDGIYWLALRSATSGTVAGWQEVKGTHYLWKLAATQPVSPVDALVFSRVTVAGAVVTVVEDVGAHRVNDVQVLATSRTTGVMSTWIFEPGGCLNVSGGQTWTHQGALFASPTQQIFCGTGTVLLNDSIPMAYPQWWGAKGDFATTGDAAPIQAAMESGVKWVELGGGGYVLEAPLLVNSFSMTLHGTYLAATLIAATATGIPTMIDVVRADAGLGLRIDGVRFTGFAADGSGQYQGIGIRASTTTFIDSQVVNCWFSLAHATSIGFSGRVVNAAFLNNTFDGGAAGIHILANSSTSVFTNNRFFAPTFTAIEFAGTLAQPINEIHLTANNFSVPVQQPVLKATYTTNLVLNGAVIESDALSNTVTITGVVLVKSDATITDLTVQGFVATGPALTKILAVLDLTDSKVVVTGGHWYGGMVNAVKIRPGSVQLLMNGTHIERTEADAFLLDTVTGTIQLLNLKVQTVVGGFLEMLNASTVDVQILNGLWRNARSGASAAAAFHVVSTGVVTLTGNTIISDGASAPMDPFFSLTTSTNYTFVANNMIWGVSGAVFSGTGYRRGVNAGDVSQYVAAAMPTTGTYFAGTEVLNGAPAVLGGGGSQYVIHGWKRLTTGTGHVLNTDWVEMRVLTGT